MPACPPHFREASGSSLWIYFYRSDGAPGCDNPRDASSRVGPGYTRGKDCAGLALTPSNYSNTLKAHCGFISIDLMARQTPTSSKNVCCGSQRSIDKSTVCNYLSHISGAHLRCYSACAVPRGAARCQKRGSAPHFREAPGSSLWIYFYRSDGAPDADLVKKCLLWIPA